MTASVPAAPRLAAPDRAAVRPIDELAGRVARLRTRASGGGMDRWLLVVGGLLLPLGVLVIVLGWLGASHTVLLFEQIPYLISGGLLGLALVVAGGLVYFAYWQTLLVRETRAQNHELTAALGRIESLLAVGVTPGGPTAGGAAPAPATLARGVPARTTSAGPVAAGPPTADAAVEMAPVLLATPTGSMLHLADCPVVAGRDKLRRVAAGTPGFDPCKICQPPV